LWPLRLKPCAHGWLLAWRAIVNQGDKRMRGQRRYQMSKEL
jgi:hypothetical protein